MKRIYRRHIFIMVILILIVGGVVLGLLFFARSVERKIATTKETSKKLALYERNRAQYDRESIQVKDLQTRVGTLENALVTTESVPTLLSSLETTATARGLIFEIQSVQTPLDTKKQKKLLITFSARGAKSTVQSFFDDLAAQPFLVHVTNFSLSTYEGEGQNIISTDWLGLATIEIQSFISQ